MDRKPSVLQSLESKSQRGLSDWTELNGVKRNSTVCHPDHVFCTWVLISHLLWVWLLAAHSWVPSRNYPPQQGSRLQESNPCVCAKFGPSPWGWWECLPVWGCFGVCDSPFCSDIITVHGVPQSHASSHLLMRFHSQSTALKKFSCLQISISGIGVF